MSGSYLIVQKSTSVLTSATAVTLNQGHRKIMQYITPHLYFLSHRGDLNRHIWSNKIV